MKNILNLIFSITVLSLSTISFARNPASGDDPNNRKETSPGISQSGTTFLGSGVNQVAICPKCEMSPVKMGDNTNPSATTTSRGSKETTGTGDGHN